MRRYGLPLLLVFSIGLILISKWKVDASFVWKQPLLTDLVVTEHYSGDLGALMLGSRRLASDIAYIQFLQYYGSRPEPEEDGHEHKHGDEQAHGHSHANISKAGNYPRVKEFGLRMLRLDAFFTGPILEIAGALAFNQKEIDAALSFLTEAIERNPSFYRYRIYTAAILYKNNRQDKELIAMLEQAIQFNDCPPLLQSVLGNLLKKYGQYEKAARVYLHTALTVPNEADRENATRKLTELLQQHPEIRRKLVPN